MESIPYDLTAVRDHNERILLLLPDKLPQLNGLAPFRYGQHKGLFIMGVQPFHLKKDGTAIQFLMDKIADRLWVCTDNGKIFTQIHRLDHKGFCIRPHKENNPVCGPYTNHAPTATADQPGSVPFRCPFLNTFSQSLQ